MRYTQPAATRNSCFTLVTKFNLIKAFLQYFAGCLPNVPRETYVMFIITEAAPATRLL